MITIIHGGHREGLSFNAAKTFERLMQEKETIVKFYSLRDHRFEFCCGVQTCQDSGECIYNDIMTSEIIPSIASSDVLIFFSPTYFNQPPAILKNFIDRCNLLLTKEDRKHLRFGAWICGQTEQGSIEDCYISLATFAEICEFKPLETGKIIRVETDSQQTQLNQDDIVKLQELVKEISQHNFILIGNSE